MTRKDYVVLAQALASVRPRPTGTETHSSEFYAAFNQWHETFMAVSTALENDNPRFDIERFTDAAFGFAGVVSTK